MTKRSQRQKERKRVKREQVRKNAEEGGKKKTAWFRLPEGVEEWKPDKAGQYLLDHLPYEVTDKRHPDGIDPGFLWYKRPFLVHHGVGVNNDSIVCPVSIGKPCPLCEHRNSLSWDDDEDLMRALGPQKFVAYNIRNPDEQGMVVSIFAYSRGKYADILEKELEEGDDENLYFFEVTDEGRTIKVRFSNESFEGHKYLQATRIDFRKREPMDEDEVLDAVVNLDDFLIVMEYDELKQLFLQTKHVEDVSKKPSSRSEEQEDNEEDEDDIPFDGDDNADEDDDDAVDDTEEDDDEGDDAAVDDTEEDEDDDDAVDDTDEDDDVNEDEDDEEEDTAPKQRRSPLRGSKKASSKKSASGKPKDKDSAKRPKCPGGGRFGRDTDKFEECDDCKYWVDCDKVKHE